MQFSVRYIVLFSAAVCVACAILVSSSAVTLEPLQSANKALDKKQNVLEAAGLREAGEKLDTAEVEKRFENIRAKLVELSTGEEVSGVDAVTFDQQKAKKDPATSRPAPKNGCTIKRIPNRVQIFEVYDDQGNLESLVLPIEGYGLWSTLLGFISLDADLTTVRGVTYYDHKETPGLGGEVDNPRWKATWPGRKVFDASGEVEIEVIKGSAPPPSEAPYKVDGLSGATITSRGVTCMIHFWLGPEVYGPLLDRYRAAERRAA